MKFYIVTTHGNLLRSYFSFISKEYTKYFNNCSIIKCYINNNNIHFKMLFEGFKNYNNSKDFSIQEFNDKNYFTLNNLNINKDVIIYFVRHGQALHNIVSYLDKYFDDKYYDPELTNDGIIQSSKVSDIILDDILNNYKYDIKNDKILYGSSCLLRAIQTNLIIKKNIDSKIINKKQYLYIIPNLNEIIYINQYFYNLSVVEYLLNKMYYTNTLNYDYHLENKNTEIVWKYYLKQNFYVCNIDILYSLTRVFKL